VKKSEPPSQEEFDALLAWLDPDRDCAGVKHEEIRSKLIKILERRQCYVAEELADETINRVSHRVKDVTPTYVGDPALYFYGVLKNVYKEWSKWWREKQTSLDNVPQPAPEPAEDVELIHEYLDKCRQELEDPEDRELILKYYEKEKRARIDNRKQLADGLGVTLNNLRIRIHRINAILQKCIVDCLNDAGSAEAGNVLAG
jgi:DNA-directed RNA polymerase specialized sigma24 family protein